MAVNVDAGDAAALGFGVQVIRIGGVGIHPESVAAEHVLPARAGDAAGVGGFPDPGGVVLQAAIDMVRVGVVEAHMVELRDGEVIGLPPLVGAVVRDPQSAVVAGEYMLRIARVDEHIVHVAVHADEAADRAEALAAILAEDHRSVGLKDSLGVLRIDDQIGEIKRPPDHPLALVAQLPGGAAIV